MTGSTPCFGVAGCGAMGLPMAKALTASNFNVYGFDVRPSDQFAGFSDKMIEDPDQFAKQCDVIICVVRDTRQVLDLCFDQQAILKKTAAPKTFVLSSTTPPDFIHELAAKLPQNVTLVDAPMSGAPHAAVAATLTFMVGGPTKTIKELTPAFEAMGNKTLHLGDLSAGMTAKVLNNFVAASTVVAVRNVLYHAKILGMDPKILLDVMDQSSGQTWFGSNFEKTVWANEPYQPDNTIGILEKDVRAFISALPNGVEPLHEAVLVGLRSLPRVPS